MYCVYVHECKVNGKRYVGITSQAPEQRWKYGWGYKNNIAFFNDIKKYGWDNFNSKIIHGWVTKEQAEIIEVALIKKYNTQNPKYGYNITAGGQNGKPEKINEICKVTKQGDLVCSYFGKKDFTDNESISFQCVNQACKRGGDNVKGFFWCYRRDAEKYELV